MWFVNGLSCAGKARSRKSVVALVCAASDHIVSVVEPEVCFYEVTVGTPAACNPADVLPEYSEDVIEIEVSDAG